MWAPQKIERFEIGQAPIEPTELNTETLSLEKPGEIALAERHEDKHFGEVRHRRRRAAARRPRPTGPISAALAALTSEA